ncbi:MAG TPA: outer membrane beta-barrel protein, partial [Gemmataceae bacterium]|nr:outer membrane beta-barrel protein [Gemmataceae bacterium]
MLITLILGASLALGQPTDSDKKEISNDSQAQTESDSDKKENGKDETPQPWLLMRHLQGTAAGDCLKQHRIEILGWTDASLTASSDRVSNLPLGFNYRANDFLLQQNWLRIDRPVDTSENAGPNLGFRIDTILPGSDYRFTVARGLFSNQTGIYGIDPIQFYGEAYLPGVAEGMNVKVGRFFAQIGAEANDAPSNLLWSHSYTFIYDPFTHTGVLSTIKLSKEWSVQAGLVLGSDDFINAVDTPTFIGSVKWAQKDNKNTVLFSVILGSGRYNQPHQFNNPNVFNLIYTHQFSKKLSYTLDSLFGYQTDVPGL